MTHHILQPRSQGNVMRHKVWKSHAYVDFNCGKWWAPAQPTSQAVSRCASSMASAKAPLGRNFHLGQVQALCPFHPLCCVVPKIIRISVSTCDGFNNMLHDLASIDQVDVCLLCAKYAKSANAAVRPMHSTHTLQ